MARPSIKGEALAAMLVVYVIVGVFLTPAGGLETRPFSDVTILGFVGVGLGSIGLVLVAASLVLLFSRPKRAPVLGILGALLNLPAIFADQLGAFHSANSPPTTITLLEWIQVFVVATVIISAMAVRRAREGPAGA